MRVLVCMDVVSVVRRWPSHLERRIEINGKSGDGRRRCKHGHALLGARGRRIHVQRKALQEWCEGFLVR